MAEKDTPPQYEVHNDAKTTDDPATTISPPAKSKPVIVVLAARKPAGKIVDDGRRLGIDMSEDGVLRSINDAILLQPEATLSQVLSTIDSRLKTHFKLDTMASGEQVFAVFEMLVNGRAVKLADQAGWEAARGFLEDRGTVLQYHFAVAPQKLVKQARDKSTAGAADEKRKGRQCMVQ